MADVKQSDAASEIVINKVLCYVSTAIHSMRNDDLVRICLAFYKEDDIISAKDIVYERVGEKPKRRRHENRMINEMQDLIDILKKCGESGISLPKYVADSYDSLPPTSGFDVIADSIVSLQSEISSLKEEISLLRESRLTESVSSQDNAVMKEDIILIKGELRKLNHKLLGNEVRRSSLLLQSLDKSLVLEKEKSIHHENNETVVVRGSDVADDSAIVAGSLAPSFADIVRSNTNSLDIENGPSRALSPSAPPLSQYSPLERGENDEMFGRDMVAGGSFSPSAPPLSQDISTLNDRGNNVASLRRTTDSDGFILVEKKRRRNMTIVGMKKNNSSNIIKSAKKHGDLYVGNCDLDTNTDSLFSYILNETGIRVVACEELETRSTVSKSFKVTLNMHDRQKLLNPNVWPEEIICRKFYKPRKI